MGLLRLICDAILKTPHLSFQRELMWCKTFQLLLKIIGGVDYKVVLLLLNKTAY